jgi:hypothetical protein
MTMRIVALIVFGAGCLLAAAGEPGQKAQVTQTERIDFSDGGPLRLASSIGVLTVEAWDRPDLDITTDKSTKVEHDAHQREKAAQQLESVRVVAERRGNELVVTTNCARHRPFPPTNILDPLAKEASLDLEYHIKAPGTARVIAHRHIAEVNTDSFTGDIQVTLHKGEIMLHLPEDGRYDIHAKSKFGDVNNDFPEEERRWWLIGHRIVNQDLRAPHKLNLRVKFGDIVILKTRVPKPPTPLIPASKLEGL